MLRRLMLHILGTHVVISNYEVSSTRLKTDLMWVLLIQKTMQTCQTQLPTQNLQALIQNSLIFGRKLWLTIRKTNKSQEGCFCETNTTTILLRVVPCKPSITERFLSLKKEQQKTLKNNTLNQQIRTRVKKAKHFLNISATNMRFQRLRVLWKGFQGAKEAVARDLRHSQDYINHTRKMGYIQHKKSR